MSVFDRNVWCLLGMPVDVMEYRMAIDRVAAAADGDQPCFISTPNLNFIVTALKDREFLHSVIHSDLVLLDGMPPVWIARIIGIPGIEKISGSNLFESLWEEPPVNNRKIRVFLFGGEEGVSQQACERMNQLARGVECVGHIYPGFSSIEDMSGESVMQEINRCGPDFVLVALGAKKGQAWIMRNKDAIQAPIISHLGAVINFAAGRIARAPTWMQTLGLEWIWRIFQEPALWKRYLLDGFALLGLVLCRVLPYLAWRWRHADRLNCTVAVECGVSESAEVRTVWLKGDCLHGTIEPLRTLFREEVEQYRSINIDLSDVELIDGAFLGLCLMLYREAIKQGETLSFQGVKRTHRRVFAWNCVEYLL